MTKETNKYLKPHSNGIIGNIIDIILKPLNMYYGIKQINIMLTSLGTNIQHKRKGIKV